MEKYVDMISPLTGGKVKEVITFERKVYKDDNFIIPVKYYICEDTGEQFTTSDQDTELMNQLEMKYNEKHGS